MSIPRLIDRLPCRSGIVHSRRREYSMRLGKVKGCFDLTMKTERMEEYLAIYS